MFIEYPKAVYKSGEYRAVQDRAEEDAANAEGWTDWHSDQARMEQAAFEASLPAIAAPVEVPQPAPVVEKRKPGRPAKAAQ